MYSIKNHPKLSYKLVNNLTGWIAFVIASTTYILTAEPTASLWDCGEFITTSVGLQVGHPPGAPLFMIISRLFAIFAPETSMQALMINYMSGLASGFTILFLFWSITHLAAKLLVRKGEESSVTQLIVIMGAGLVGALAYTFSDTFWFSAVEGEVYALSSLFTAVVFWAILRWEDVAFKPYSNRWLVLIAYLMGLSIGVHLLNLLAIPAIVFVYYFKKYTISTWGIVKTAILSMVILGVVNFMLIPGIIKVAGWFELLFTNGMGAPFNTGVIVYAILLMGGLAWGIYYTLRHGHAVVNTILTCFLVIIIGYSSYAMVVIRSISNPPIDENSPDNVFSLLSYINRDQYGDSPLLYGQYYNAPIVDFKEGAPTYYQNKETGKYDIIGRKLIYKYDDRFCTLFPRMHSNQRPYFASEYERWAGKPSGLIYTTGDGEMAQAPSFGNNMRYFFNYQLNHMYFRYFMWNFAGRQNDTQGYSDIRHGNWISGINFLDEARLGNQEELPDSMKDSKSRNVYFMLPFLLGIFGMLYQFGKNKDSYKDWTIVMLLFVLTGIAIIVFLNQTPREPRERDYAYAGSFYAFSIWIGLGVLWVWELLNNAIKNRRATAIVSTVVCLIAVPLRMAAENWDDHDRSGRYATLAHAKNYLNSCAPNAILFTYGDNDTFPLWYAQEVEGIRRDIRIVNLSLLSGSWYIDQIARKTYETDPVPISFTHHQYHDGVRDIIYVDAREGIGRRNLAEVLEFVGSDDRASKAIKSDGEAVDYIPTDKVFLPVDSAKVVANGTVSAASADKIVKRLEFGISGRYLTKSQMMVLDILASNNWERPVYFGIGMGSDSYMGLEKYFQLDGAAYRVVPIETPVNKDNMYDYGRIETDTLYDILMNRFDYGDIKNPKVYIDNFHENTIGIMKYRNTFLRLSKQLLDSGDSIRAIAALDKCLEEIPTNKVPIPFDNTILDMIEIYYNAGDFEKGDSLILDASKEHAQWIRYYNSLGNRDFDEGLKREKRISEYFLASFYEIAKQAKRDDLALKIEMIVNTNQ